MTITNSYYWFDHRLAVLGCLFGFSCAASHIFPHWVTILSVRILASTDDMTEISAAFKPPVCVEGELMGCSKAQYKIKENYDEQ